jgi:dienelactone hydrolase
MSLAHQQPARHSSTSTISSDISHRRFKEQISSPPPIRTTNIRSSFQISSKENLPISPGTSPGPLLTFSQLILNHHRYPPDNDEKGKALGNFFSTTGAPPTTAAKIPGLVKDISAAYPSIKTWGIVGFCWGGKIVSLTTSTDSTPFKAGAECHPAMVDPSEATNIKIPLAMLASGDEPEEDVKKFEANLTGEKHVEIFKDQIHGWMAARSDLEDARVKSEYERGYKTLLEFFGKHL